MKQYKTIIVFILVMVIVASMTLFRIFLDNSIKIYIGYQSVTAQTWPALIMKDKKLLEHKLQELFPNKKFKVVWSDEISGAAINTAMISGKCHFGFMGDMPLLLNMNKSETIRNYNSALMGFSGKGVNGANQAIVVPKNSSIKKVADLKGKTISTPIGSSAHFMLLKILEKYDLIDSVNIVHQDIALASQMLSTKGVDAFAVWAPYPNFLIDKGFGCILVDGTDSEIDYLAGVMANKNWADKNTEIVRLFIESLIEAQEFIAQNAHESALIFSRQSGFSYDVALRETTNISWDFMIKEKDVFTLNEKMKFLVEMNQIGSFNLNKYIFNN